MGDQKTAAPTRERITVMIPAYQHQSYLGTCLDSVLEQVVDADITILIGEDGSTDGTLAICAEYAAKDPRVHVFARDKNRPKVMIDGCMTGRANVLDLLMRCDGDYAIRIDGDDRWCDTAMLQKQVDALRKNPSAMGCYHATGRIDHDGRATGKLFNEQLPERMELEDTITHLSPFHVSSFLYRDGGRFRKPPALAHQVGSLDLLLFALVAATGPLLKVPGVMSCYRAHEGGLTRSRLFARSNDKRLRIFLWTGLVQLLHGRGSEKAFRVCDDLLNAALHDEVTGRDALLWAKILFTRPRFFLWRAQRFGSVLRLLRKGMGTWARSKQERPAPIL